MTIYKLHVIVWRLSLLRVSNIMKKQILINVKNSFPQVNDHNIYKIVCVYKIEEVCTNVNHAYKTQIFTDVLYKSLLISKQCGLI